MEAENHKKKLKIFLLSCKKAGNKLGATKANSHPRGRNFALNGTQGEVGVSLKEIFFFLGRLIFHSVTTPVNASCGDNHNLHHCNVFLLPFNGNGMCIMAYLLLN